MSLVNRLRWDDLRRPFYLLVGDEDTVSHGDLWVQLIEDPGTGQAYQYNGKFTSAGGTEVWYSVLGKVCHGIDVPFGEPYTIEDQPPLPGQSGPPEHRDPTEAVYWMVQKARNELDKPMVTDPPSLRPLWANPANPLLTLDSSDHVLARNPFVADNLNTPTGDEQGLLQEAAGFQRHGHGTWLGAGDSLTIARSETGEGPESVFVGSADGVVTRFAVQMKNVTLDQTGQPGTIFPLVEQARTNDGGVPYSLGYGTWALAVGDIDDGHPGLELVVCAYRRIALFDADTLDLIDGRVREAPFGDATGPDAAWVYTRPRRVQVTECNSANPGKEIVFTTLHGHVVVLDKNLQKIGEHTESGIVDLLVGPGSQTNGDFTKPIHALSARGHLVSLEIDSGKTGTEMGLLRAVSQLQYGDMQDLEHVQWSGQSRIAALFAGQPATKRSIRIFEPSNLDLVAQFGDVRNPVPPPPPPGGEPPPYGDDTWLPTPIVGVEPSLTIAFDGSGQQYFVVAYGDHLIVWDDSGNENYLGLKNLKTFAPAQWAACVAAGDIDTSTPGDEVVVSTLTGRVVWFKLGELYNQVRNLGLPRQTGVDGTGAFFDDRTNTALPATWGLAVKPAAGSEPAELHAIDQSGTWWKVDPATGTPAFVRQLEVEDEDELVPPVANLAYAGPGMTSLQTGMGGTQHGYWEVASATSPAAFAYEIRSTPYVPAGLPAGNFWILAPAPSIAEAARTGLLVDGFWVFPTGGAAVWTTNPNPTQDSYAAWWIWDDARNLTPGAGDYYPNLVQMVRYDLTASLGPVIESLWNSTGPPDPQGSFTRPELPSPENDRFGIALRTERWGDTELWNLQAARIGRVRPGSAVPQVVVSSLGGRVMLLDGNDGRVVDDSSDYGFGGMALALEDLDNDGDLEVLFAPGYTQASHDAGYLESRLWVLDHAGGNPTPNNSGFSELTPDGGVALGDIVNLKFDYPGYGACGIAVADLDKKEDGKLEIVVTTLNGELIVFRWDNGQPVALHYRKVEGGLGAFNSIVVADLIPDPGNLPEVYIAGTYGIRRFDVVPQP